MPLTQWRSLDSEGHIADLPASCIQYRYSINEFVPITALGLSYQRIYMRWAVQIVTSGGGVIFEQRVCVPLNIVSLGVPGAQLYTWWAEEATIRTTVCGTRLPSAVLADPIGTQPCTVRLQQVDGTWPESGAAYIGTERGPYERVEFEGMHGPSAELTARGVYGYVASHDAGEIMTLAPRTMGADQGNLVPGGGGDYTELGIWLTLDWESPIYLLNVPQGSGFRILFHNVGAYALRTSLAAIQTRVCKATGRPWLYIPEHGAWITAVPDEESGTTRILGGCSAEAVGAHAQDNRFAQVNASGHIRGEVSDLYYPPVLLRAGRLSMRVYLVGEREGSIWLLEADSEGDLDRWSGPMKLADGGTILGACTDDTGAVLYLLVQAEDGEIYLHQCYLLRAGGTLTGASAVTVRPVVLQQTESGTQAVPLTGLSSQLHTLRWHDGRLYLVADVDGETRIYTSSDGGATWTE